MRAWRTGGAMAALVLAAVACVAGCGLRPTARKPGAVFEVRLAADGGMTLDGAALDLEDLGKRVRKLRDALEDPVMRLVADPKASYQQVIRIMNEARAAGQTRIIYLTRSVS